MEGIWKQMVHPFPSAVYHGNPSRDRAQVRSILVH